MKRWIHSVFAEGFRQGIADRKRGCVTVSGLPPWPKLEDQDYAKAYRAGYQAGWTVFGTGGAWNRERVKGREIQSWRSP